MGDEIAAGLALYQASEQIDGKIAEIERLLTTLALTHRSDASPIADRKPTTSEIR